MLGCRGLSQGRRRKANDRGKDQQSPHRHFPFAFSPSSPAGTISNPFFRTRSKTSLSAQDFRSSIERHIKAPVRPIDRVRQFISAKGIKNPVELPAIAVHFEILDDSTAHFFAFSPLSKATRCRFAAAIAALRPAIRRCLRSSGALNAPVNLARLASLDLM
jgi:hypothetical protein